MDLDEYQRLAAQSDRFAEHRDDAESIALLGLAGEVGSLLTEYKKRVRDAGGYPDDLFLSRVSEEAGDILWYLASLTRRAGLSLSEIARSNLSKVQGRWLAVWTEPRFFDEGFPEHEQLPRHFDVYFSYVADQPGSRVALHIEGRQVGNTLTDNSYDEDGYRFHDAYHFTFATLLGWSPVTRRNLRRKRKSRPEIDEVEDGGRGWVIEEAIAALAFAAASQHDFFLRSDTVDQPLLRAVSALTQTAEVRVRSSREWEAAIVSGSRIFKQLRDHGGGKLICDLEARQIEFVPSA